MAESNNYAHPAARQNLEAWQKIINPEAAQSGNQYAQSQAEIAMSKPLQPPANPNEDAGLAPYFGGITTILVLAFLIWKFTKRSGS